MGFLDRIVSGRPEEPKETPSHSSGAVEESRELLRDFAPTSVAGPGPEHREKLYDPYEGISQALGGRKVVFKLPEGPEFVFAEEAAVKRRSWGENLQFYTGLGYLTGGSAGIAAGAFTALQQKPEVGMDSMKLKANRLLNSSGSLGRRLGNGIGVLGMYFAVMESLAFNYVGPEVPDAMNTMLAGFGAAALFRSPRGVRQAAAAGLVGAIGAGALAVARQVYPQL